MRVALLLAVAVALPALPSQVPATPAAQRLAAAASSIDVAELRASLEFLASDEMKGRATPSPELDRASEWLAGQFRAAGLEPAFASGFLQRAPVKRRGRGRGAESGDPAAPAGEANNVGAVLRGSDPELASEVVVFSAHYDHIGMRGPRRDRAGETEAAGDGETPQDTICNGADDDATGTAAVLQLARAFRQAPRPRRTLLFLCFYGEELGMLGSDQYCRAPALPLAKTMANFNLEMLGRPDDIPKNAAWVTGWDVSDFGKLIVEPGERAGVRFYENGRLSKMLFSASDNISFAKRGVPAHSISAGSLHADYHQPSDEVAKIDFENMAAVVRGIFYAGFAMGSGGPVPCFKEGSSYEEARRKLKVEAAAEGR